MAAKSATTGLMFFSERPDGFFPYTRIEVVDKPDPTGVGMTEKIFEGPLDRQLRDALSYIKNYIIKEEVIKISGQAEAERVFNIPYDAVEEALSNAVYHTLWKAFHNLCYAKLIVMQSQFRNPFKAGKFGTFNFA